MRVKIRCSRCGWESVEVIDVSAGEALRPKESDLNVKGETHELTNLLGASVGASETGTRHPGIKISKEEHIDEKELLEIREFLLRDIVYSDEMRRSKGAKYQISTVPWRMGDRFKDVDITSSEIKAMGIEDLRLIPGVTLQRREYGFTKAEDKELLRGSRFIVLLDVSGSMFAEGAIFRLGSLHPNSKKVPFPGKTKIGKALLIAEKIYHLSKRSDFEFNLAIFSDIAAKMPAEKLDTFFNSEFSPGLFSGGTVLSNALALYTGKEYRNSNLVILSDMDLSDFEKTEGQLRRIGEVTNSFKILLFNPPPRAHTPIRFKDLQDEQRNRVINLFPDRNVKILRIFVD